MIALIAALTLLDPTPPTQLVVDSALLARLQTLAAGLHSEIVLCLTGTTRGTTAVATGFTMPDPHVSNADHATFGPCPSDALATWHNHPREQSGTDPRTTPRDLCALSETDIRTVAAGPQPFVVIAVDRGTWCWWSKEQVRGFAAGNALRGPAVAGQISLY